MQTFAIIAAIWPFDQGLEVRGVSDLTLPGSKIQFFPSIGTINSADNLPRHFHTARKTAAVQESLA
jgi:hypothetical protein